MNYEFWSYPVHFLAYGLGLGMIPFAPGTFGTLLSVAIFWFMARLGALAYAAVTGILFVAGIFICGQTARDTGAVDSGVIVFDEIVGFLVAVYLLPRKWRWIAAGFVLFRIFDIWKPWPIYLAEEISGLGTAIMTDDLIAGLFVLGILQIAWLVLRKPTV